MFIRSSEIGDADVFDVCVVGSGPAGMTVALELEKSGKKILLLEAGDRYYTDESQEHYRGRVVGDPYFDLTQARLRCFGGTSNHWHGASRPLDGMDLKDWPIDREELGRYLGRTLDILEIEKLENDEELEGGKLKRVYFGFSPPVRFADKYEERLTASKNVFVALHANIVGLSTNGDAIESAMVFDEEQNRRTVRARYYVLATGGIENSRLLLWFNEQNNGQVVKNAKTLGRYWMEHPHAHVGDAILVGKMVAEERDELVLDLGEFFAPTEQILVQRKILNGVLLVENRFYDETKELIRSLACVAPDLSKRFFRLLEKRLVCGTKVFAQCEQEPRYDNRVELSRDADQFGIPRLTLYWEKSEKDLKTISVIAELFGEHLASTNTGRLRVNDYMEERDEGPLKDSATISITDDNWPGGCHHMGGTRMALSPTKGIVDADCKVFGQQNLYVAGSSVFPTVGYANPTLTIVQLALRLADHLKNRI